MKLRRSSILTVVVVAAFGIGVIAVQASPGCQRIVREYREKVLPHHFSKATLARWADWGKSHPNFKPKPRLKPALAPEETLSKVQFDCLVPLTHQDEALLLPPIPETTLMAQMELPVFPAPAAPAVSLIGIPTVVPPVLTGGDVPEPSSFVLLASALGLLFAFRRYGSGGAFASTRLKAR